MKIKHLVVVTGILIITSCVVSKKKYTDLELENAKLKKDLAEAKNPTIDMGSEPSKVSYAVGMNVAQNIQSQGMEKIDSEAVSVGFKDYLSGDGTKMTQQEAQQTVQTYFTQLQKSKLTTQTAEGVKFLAENAKKPGVVSLPSGLQYKIIKKGNGPIPTVTDRVKTHYTGTLINGTKFDSSVDRGTPATFGVTQVIKGWVEALQLMPVGSKWELYIPYHLAYGERGSGAIPAYSTLIFEIELIEIVK